MDVVFYYKHHNNLSVMKNAWGCKALHKPEYWLPGVHMTAGTHHEHMTSTRMSDLSLITHVLSAGSSFGSTVNCALIHQGRMLLNELLYTWTM